MSNGGGTSFTNSNNITVGQVTASAISVTTLSVVTITSSIDYASGSNIFGTKSTDTQLFTGSVNMSGSLSVSGPLSVTVSGSVTPVSVTNNTSNYGRIRISNSSSTAGNYRGFEVFNGATFKGGLLQDESTDAFTIFTTGGSAQVINADKSITMANGLAVTGTLSSTGNATIGAAAAATNRILNINGVVSKASRIAFQESGVDRWLIGNGAASENGNFEIYDATNGNNVIFTRTGNVGIGVTPTQRLDIATASGDCIIRLGNGTSTARFAVDNDGPYIYPLTAGDNSLRVFTPAGGTAMTLDVSGNLSVAGSISTTTTAASSISRTLSVGALIANGNLNAFGFVPSFIGLSAGYNYSGGDAETNMIFGASSASQQMRFQRWDGTTLTNVLTLTGTGNVGIGTTSPAFSLHNAGSTQSFAALASTAGGGPVGYAYTACMYCNPAVGGQADCLRFLNSAGTVIGLNGIVGHIYIYAADTATGGNSSTLIYRLHTEGNGASNYSLVSVGSDVRGTNPVASVAVISDGAGGGVKIQITTASSGISGARITTSFFGTVMA